jgi:hypothetical protein
MASGDYALSSRRTYGLPESGPDSQELEHAPLEMSVIGVPPGPALQLSVQLAAQSAEQCSHWRLSLQTFFDGADRRLRPTVRYASEVRSPESPYSPLVVSFATRDQVRL